MSNELILGGEAANPNPHVLGLREQVASRTATLETRFLTILRYSMLIFAALALVVSAGLLIVGLVQQIGRTKVEPQNVRVGVGDISPASANSAPVRSSETSRKESVSADVRRRTLKLYNDSFRQYERPGTKTAPQEIVDLIWPADRIRQMKDLAGGMLENQKGEVLASEEAVFNDALHKVADAVRTKTFQSQLTRYRDAKKVQVCAEQFVNRTRRETYWDSYSTSCENWAESPIGCEETRTVNEPSFEKVCAMKFPENIEAPAQAFATAVERYAASARQKVDQARKSADEQTDQNSAKKAAGQARIVTGGQLFLGFLGVMFLYLLIALERHHRTLMTVVAAQRRDHHAAV